MCIRDRINLTSTLTSLLPFTLLNFWSVRTLNILDCISSGISETWSIRRVPLLAFSSAPYEIEPFSFSSPNNSNSYLLISSKAPFKTINGFLFLADALWIFLAINSFPDPEGPLINTLLSVTDIFLIWSIIFTIFLLFPINS